MLSVENTVSNDTHIFEYSSWLHEIIICNYSPTNHDIFINIHTCQHRFGCVCTSRGYLCVFKVRQWSDALYVVQSELIGRVTKRNGWSQHAHCWYDGLKHTVRVCKKTKLHETMSSFVLKTATEGEPSISLVNLSSRDTLTALFSWATKTSDWGLDFDQSMIPHRPAAVAPLSESLCPVSCAKCLMALEELWSLICGGSIPWRSAFRSLRLGCGLDQSSSFSCTSAVTLVK